ncbi:hypothetical protein [Marinactinospora rubrisoli]|uniref:Uncharacterized protein n=1 Tax=Marinactinospora rubrisoli TaxID=2715399 RepID=A0ABW2KFP8_9ACTN
MSSGHRRAQALGHGRTRMVAVGYEGAEPPFLRGEVIEADPPRRLTYSVGFVPAPATPTATALTRAWNCAGRSTRAG